MLDPCGGTGAFVAEILRRIQQTCQDRGDGALSAQKVKNAAMRRIFSFEILPSSYIVAHWQVGALLKKIGAPLADGERAAIYLTNSLTNWDASEEQMTLNIAGLGEERDAANKVKREQPILVVIGNPPYNAFAGVSPAAEDNLVAPYKEGLIHRWNIRKFNLDDLYLRFFRIAENCVTKNKKGGIICYISNYSYVSEPSFVVMRDKLLTGFNKIWIDSLNGDSRRTGKKTPEGKPDPSVFSTKMNTAGIRVGTAVGLFIRQKEDKQKTAVVNFRNFWGIQKREDLESSLDTPNFDRQYEIANPQEWNKFSFVPLNVNDRYLTWLSLVDLCAKDGYFDGMDECRGGALYDIAAEPLGKRMRDYFNPHLSWDEYQEMGGGLAKDASTFNARQTRDKALKEKFGADNIVPYTMRPLDNGYCYYTNLSRVWNRSRPKLWEQLTLGQTSQEGNHFILSRKKNAVQNEGAAMLYTGHLSDRSSMNGIARHIPFFLHDKKDMTKAQNSRANLSAKARKYLTDLGFAEPDHDSQAAEIIWLHALAIGYSAKYQSDHADGLRIDWPRIPLPQNREILEQSAALGARIKNLLSMTNPADDPFIINELATPSGEMGNLQAADYWGYRDGKGKVYPGIGKTENSQWKSAEAQKFAALGIPLRVYLNDGAYWDNVPSRAWEYRIGGFQVAKKWLSYRAGKVLGRALTDDEVLTFADIIRRLSALLLLADELDGNYDAAQNKVWAG